MEWTGLNELRSRYLKFFESKNHTALPSFSLVPKDDPSLLLINSGMAPLKKFFLGQATPPNKRVTTCQKCIRTPDIERVGKTARHGTYFEMLGNFSFGDYFKHEATAWAWEFLTEELQIPKDKLWPSIFEDDDETYEIWTKEIGVDPAHIVRLGREDNFWEIGSGPCGPCSEIYFDRGEAYGCGSPDCAPGCDCDRYMEIWNLVFSQFDGDGNGNYQQLEHPNIDTGMGLERLACIMQGVDNLFEVDTVQNIMTHISQIAGVTYKQNANTDVSLRVITDHVRSTTMMIGDGIVPQNEGRGYVLRRLLRRAARHGRLLGITEPFLYKVADTVIQENASAYPILVENRDYIVKVIHVEEERFAKTIGQGIEMLSGLISRIEDAAANGKKILSGEQAFKLYDTFGFPIDLTREIAEEHQIDIDEKEFNRYMDEQRERARAARAALGDMSWEDDVLADLDVTTNFVGYDTLETQGTIVALVVDNQLVDSIGLGEKGALVLDTTSFYAESGGQVGDTGWITGNGTQFTVGDCQKSVTGQFMHVGTVEKGALSVGDTVSIKVDGACRHAIMRNHSACHLLQQALREVLGTHVHQAGSMVDPDVCRFDFAHFSAVTAEELDRVEYLVNDMILSAMPIEVRLLTLDEAKEEGAMALFDEKYGDQVRMVDMGGRSVELCGGTHVDNTAKIGLFKIQRESSIAAGVRRIEATTGRGVLKMIADDNALMAETAGLLKVGNVNEIPKKVASITAELKTREKELQALTQQIAEMRIQGLMENTTEVGSVRLLYATLNSVKAETLRAMADKMREVEPALVVVIASIQDGKASLACACGKDAIADGLHAGNLIKQVAGLVGGSGGGRADSAMGGATEIFRIDEAFVQLPSMVMKMLNTK